MFDLSIFEHLLTSGRPDLAQRYVDIQPPPADVLTLEQALLRIAAASSSLNIPSPGPWYGHRHRLRLTCTQEYRLELVGFLHYYM